MVVEYLITIKTLTTKKTKESTKIRNNFFVKFRAPFSQKIINIQYTYHLKLLYVQQFDSGTIDIDTIIISLLIENHFIC